LHGCDTVSTEEKKRPFDDFLSNVYMFWSINDKFDKFDEFVKFDKFNKFFMFDMK
jgi:hypothetical protein